jgi:hypothetical protein
MRSASRTMNRGHRARLYPTQDQSATPAGVRGPGPRLAALLGRAHRGARPQAAEGSDGVALPAGHPGPAAEQAVGRGPAAESGRGPLPLDARPAGPSQERDSLVRRRGLARRLLSGGRGAAGGAQRAACRGVGPRRGGRLHDLGRRTPRPADLDPGRAEAIADARASEGPATERLQPPAPDLPVDRAPPHPRGEPAA